MPKYREQAPERCQRCARQMVFSVGDRIPEDDDYAICCRCAGIFVRVDGCWRVAVDEVPLEIVREAAALAAIILIHSMPTKETIH
jgi:hypothetical protein